MKKNWFYLFLFMVPSTVPPLNEATRRLVERANAEAKK
mgnify:CR=1 FL=1